MKEELRKAYKKKEKAERLLSDLDKMTDSSSISDDQRGDLKSEYSNMLDDANRSIKALKSKLRKQFDKKADELEALKRELALQSSRYEIDEITSKSYYEQAKPLKKLIKQLEKEVSVLNSLIHSNSSADLGASSTQVKKKAARQKTPPGSKRTFSMGTVLVISIITVITVFVAVIAVVKEAKLAASITPTTADTTEDARVTISNIGVSDVTTTDAIITWDTNKPTRSQLEFGITSNLGMQTSLSEELRLNHRIHLSGLDPGTGYYYRVRSVDAYGEEAMSGVYELLTAEVQYDGEMLKISEINVSDITDSSATITWLTNKEATGQVEYWVTSADNSFTPVNEELSTSHEVNLIGLGPGTIYNFRVRSIDASGNEVISDKSMTFMTIFSVPTSDLVGKQAPDFTLLNLEGEKVSLKDFRGSWVMVVFWQAGCSACRTEMPHIQNYLLSRAHDEPAILTINIREKESFIRIYAESQGLTFPILLDQVALVKDYYKVKRLPTLFLIDADGIVQKELRQVFDSVEDIEDVVSSAMGSAR